MEFIKHLPQGCVDKYFDVTVQYRVNAACSDDSSMRQRKQVTLTHSELLHIDKEKRRIIIMKNRKTFIAFGLLLLLLVIFMGITLYTNILSFMEVSSQADLKVSGMVNTLTRVQEQINSQESEYRTKTENMMELMCLALRPYVKENTYNGPELFIDESNERSNDGIVVRIEDNGNVIYPEGFSGRFELQNESDQVDRMPVMSSAALINEDGSSVSVLVSAKKIEGNFYYLDWWKTENYRSFVNYEKTIGEAIAALEKLYDAKLLLVWQPQEESQNNETEILYVSEELGTPESFKDLGITQEDILLETAKLTIGKKIYTATYEQLMIFDRPAKAVVLLNPVSNNIYILNCIVIASGFMLLCIGGLILWLHWIKDYSRDHELTENQMRSWRLSQLRKRAFAVGLNGALLLFLLLLAYQLMGNLSRTSQSNQESLDIMMARLEDSSKRVASAKQDAEEWGIYYAGRIADLYSRVPETHSPEFLKKANELIGSESIMIFDSKGKELLSSNGYVGFTLGDGVNTEKDFTYLLNGIAHIVHEPKMDQFTGKTLQTIGVKMDVGDPASYGAVIVAIDPEITWESTERQEIANYVRMLTHQESLSFIIREASGKVAYTSDSELLEKTPDEIDLDLETLQPVSLETFMIMAKKWYGAYNRDEQFHYFFMTNADSIWGDSLKFALFSAVYFMLVCQLISLYVLGTSREDFIEFTKDAEQLKDKLKQKSGITIDTEALDAFRYEERGDRSLKEWWHDITPDQKIGLLTKLTITHDAEGKAVITATIGEGEDAKEKTLTGSETILFVYEKKAEEHTHVYDAGTVTKEPTCTEKGVKTFTCSCGDSYTEEIPALGHDWNEPGYSWAEDGSACTASRSCKRDASHTESESAKPVETVTKEPTCTEKGEKTLTANFENSAFAAQTKTVEIPALGHDYAHGRCKRCDGIDPNFQPKLTDTTNGRANWGSDYVATCDALKKDVQKVLVDGTELPASDYSVSEKDGSAIITIKGSAVKKLKVGAHKLTVVCATGTAEKTLNVSDKPKTGDADMSLWLGLLTLSALGSAAAFVTMKKKFSAR